MDDISARVSRALDDSGVKPDPDTVKAVVAAVQAADQPTTNHLWQYLVVGMLVLTGISLVGILWSVLDGRSDTDPTIITTAFTGLLAGLLGLFVNPGSRS